MQVSPSAIPDEEGEHMTDVEGPTLMEDASAPALPTHVSLRVTHDIDPNSQLYLYHLRLRPSAANYVAALIMMDRCTFFVATATYRSGSPAETAGLISSSWVEVYGPSAAIHTERAPSFAADLQESMNLIAEVEIRRTTSTATLDGPLERRMCSLTRVLCRACSQSAGEEAVLPKAVLFCRFICLDCSFECFRS